MHDPSFLSRYGLRRIFTKYFYSSLILHKYPEWCQDFNAFSATTSKDAENIIGMKYKIFVPNNFCQIFANIICVWPMFMVNAPEGLPTCF